MMNVLLHNYYMRVAHDMHDGMTYKYGISARAYAPAPIPKRFKMHVPQTIGVIVSEDTRMFAVGNLSNSRNKDKAGEAKIQADLAIARQYNKRKYQKVRVWYG